MDYEEKSKKQLVKELRELRRRVAESKKAEGEPKRAEQALRRSEEQLAGIIASVTDHMSMMDEHHNIVWANDVAKRLFGPDLIGKKCYAAYHHHDKICDPCIVANAFVDGKIHEHETEVIGTNGEKMVFWCTASVSARHGDDRPRLVVEISRDITERKGAEDRLNAYAQEIEAKNVELEWMTQELSEANEKLEEADQIKNEFISILAHDLGTPIAIMKGNIYMIERGFFGDINEKQSEKLDSVLRGAERLDKLCRDTLDLSRMDVGTMSLEKEPVMLNNLIAEAVEDIHRLADERNQEISMELPDIDTVQCEPSKIRQVLDSYLSNAVRYTGEGGKISVGADQADGETTVWVKDTGRGLPPEELEKVFERFYRTGDRVEGSTGLGLAIVKGLVEQHGGRAWCESEGEGKGTTFYFTLPDNPEVRYDPEGIERGSKRNRGNIEEEFI